MSRIFAFIDESGNASAGRGLFVSSAIWCFPKMSEGHRSVLRYTIRSLKRKVKDLTGIYPDEIHYSSGLKRYADELITQCISTAFDDESIPNIGHPWDGHPLGFTFSFKETSFESCLSLNSMDGRTSPDFGNLIRARAIADLMLPLIYFDNPESIQISLIFDSPMWKNAVSYYGRNFDKLHDIDNLRLESFYEDSSAVPGLQIADLSAGILRHHVVEGIHKESLKILLNNEIKRLMTQGPKRATP